MLWKKTFKDYFTASFILHFTNLHFKSIVVATSSLSLFLENFPPHLVCVVNFFCTFFSLHLFLPFILPVSSPHKNLFASYSLTHKKKTHKIIILLFIWCENQQLLVIFRIIVNAAVKRDVKNPFKD